MGETYAVVICARMGSERLPGKALAVYCPDGTPNLLQIVNRWQASRRNPTIIVATTHAEQDKPIADLCAASGVTCYRYSGPEWDVVGRMDAALLAHAPEARWVARGMADNPLAGVGLTDWRFDVLSSGSADGLFYGDYHAQMTYAATTDLWSRAAWDRIAAESEGEQREHAGNYYWHNLSRFNAVYISPPPREYLRPYRTELDTPEDLALFKEIWLAWSVRGGGGSLPTSWALDWLESNTEAAKINAEVKLKSQTVPDWNKGGRWLCERCDERLGALVAGDLVIRCAKCGTPRKFYARKPEQARRYP